eukprot:gene8651-9583_t
MYLLVPSICVFISLLVQSFVGHILRLPCKEVGEFTIVKDNLVLQGSIINTLSGLEDFDCEHECRMNPQCKSINIEKEGSKLCQLNSVSTGEISNGESNLVAKFGWNYKTTNYSAKLIGENCQILKPCPQEFVCQDLCSCPNYECLPPGPGKGATLMVELKHRADANKIYHAYYSTFEIGNEADGYRLNVAGYSGNASDSLQRSNGMKFTTKDRDNDLYEVNCAVLYKGGWWHRGCFQAMLNNLYPTSTNPSPLYMSWRFLKQAWGNIIFSEMKLRFLI